MKNLWSVGREPNCIKAFYLESGVLGWNLEANFVTMLECELSDDKKQWWESGTHDCPHGAANQ